MNLKFILGAVLLPATLRCFRRVVPGATARFGQYFAELETRSQT